MVLDTDPAARPGTPTVLLVPGYTGSKEDFAPLLDPLGDAGYRVVAVDQRGQHESPGGADPDAYTVRALADDVLTLIDELGTPVHLVGHSFGGLVGRAAVIARPAAVRSLTLMDSGPAALEGARRHRIEQLEPVLAAGGVTAVYAVMEREAAADPAWQAMPVVLRDFRRRCFLASHEVALREMGAALRSEPDRVAELAATGVPVLVLFGVDDDAWSPQVQREMADRLGATVSVVPAARHSPAVENPTATLTALCEFWSALSVTGR